MSFSGRKRCFNGGLYEMLRPLFDSKSEKNVFARLDRRWSKYVDVYPHIPIMNVLGFEEVRLLDIPARAKDYLQKTEFDFVVCEKESSIPQLAIEFDGIGHGFSRDGSYVPVATPINDPHRKLKLNAKLSACEALNFPLVIVSYPETMLLWEQQDALTILDAIIGEILAANRTSEDINQQMANLSSTFVQDPTGEAADWALFNIEMENQLECNPIHRRTADMRKKIPISGSAVEFLRDRDGYIGGRFSIYGGIECGRGVDRVQPLVSLEVYLRDLNCMGCSSQSLLESVGEYLLIRKALREVGPDPVAWHKLLESAPWVER